MTELERRAMLGNNVAQQECTKNGIMIPCPCGAENPVMKVQKTQYGFSGTFIRCNKCGLSMFSPDKKAVFISGKLRNVPINNHREIAIRKWNTRSAPPIGRCGDCKSWVSDGLVNAYGRCEKYESMRKRNKYCSGFEPKQTGGNSDENDLS